MRRAIAVAESVAPAVLWVDEIDKAFAGSQGSALADGGTTARVFGTFLTWLSEKTAPVFVVATAKAYSLLATNELHETCMATPAISDGTLFFRTREKLIAIAEPK